MSLQHIETILTQTTALRKAYALIGRQPGERFNLFRILGMESDEVRTHSMLLAELLHPQGSHGMGSIFLELFLSQFRLPNFDAGEALLSRASVTAEYFIGKIGPDSGGRIDLVIEYQGRRILIENKIFAGDQPRQLLRYHRFDQEASLLYLTLFGSKPSDESTGKGALSADKYRCISYETDILRWLEKCQEKAVRVPNVRESLAQYIELIKFLTHQQVDAGMQNELLHTILATPEQLQSFVELQSLAKPVYNRLIENWKPELENIAAENGLWLFTYLEPGKKWQGFAFGNALLEEAGIQITFQFETFPHGLLFGFSYPRDPSNERKPLQKGKNLTALKERFRSTFNAAHGETWWVAYTFWSEYPADRLCAEILTGTINQAVREKIGTLMEIAKEILKEGTDT